MGIASDKIKNLRVVSFDWKDSGEREIGLIAEEVHSVFPEAVYWKDGKIEGLKTGPLLALCIKSIQEILEKDNEKG